ncbi:TolC family protein [Ekhidna sp.]|jgi:outer membrane protein|uniref:TolC family protein n=1 Tax=Ekhidna sp. TaxID=2608089 RepID=UPI0032EDC1F7
MIKLLLLFALIQPGDTLLTEDKVIELALEHNFDIRLEKYNLKVAENNNTIGNAGMLPTVGVSGSSRQTIQDTEQQFISGDGQSVDGAKTTVYTAGASLDWTLFDGFRMFATKDRLEEISRLNQMAFKNQVQDAISDVLKSFYNTALEQERLALLESTLKLSEERVTISKEKYEVGKASKLEYLQAQVDYNSDQSALVKQQEVIAIQKLQLLQLIGIQEGYDSFTLSYTHEISDKLKDLANIESNAIQQNPMLKQLRSQQEVNILTIKENERDRLPTLDFNLGYNYSNLSAEAGFLQSNISSGVTYGLTATMTLFDGLNRNRTIQNAKILSEQSLTAYEQGEAQLRTAVRSGLMTLQNAQILADLEQKNLAVAEENVSIALERYRVGKSNPIEVREAQNNAVNAQIRYIEALNTAKIAEIELLRLSGNLLGE